jgi:hypothetical protein
MARELIEVEAHRAATGMMRQAMNIGMMKVIRWENSQRNVLGSQFHPLLGGLFSFRGEELLAAALDLLLLTLGGQFLCLKGYLQGCD